MAAPTSSLVPSGPRAGWTLWPNPEAEGFFDVLGAFFSFREGEGRARVAIETRRLHANRSAGLHGGLMAGFADHAYFIALQALGRSELIGGVTVDLTMQYFGAGTIGPDLEAAVELLRETGRLLFLRMTLSQNGVAIAASGATLRKPPKTQPVIAP